MAIYEFKCMKCNRKFILKFVFSSGDIKEIQYPKCNKKFAHSSKDIKEIRCPCCGSKQVQEMASGFTCGLAGQGPGGLKAMSKCGSFRFGCG